MEVSGIKMLEDMNRVMKYFAAAFVIVAAASCAKENADTVAPEQTQDMVNKVFSASLETDTKTTLHTDGKTVHWTAGDKIALMPAGSTNHSTFSIIEDSIEETFAAFEGQTVDADAYVGIYPAEALDHSETSWDNSGIIHFFKGFATQYANAGNFPTTDYGNANIAVSTSSKDGHLYFKNANAYLKFSLSCAGATEIVVSADAVSNDAGHTSTSSMYNLGGVMRYKNGSMYAYSGDTPISFKVDDNKTEFEQGVVYYLAIPAVVIDGLKMTVKDANGSTLASFSKSSFSAEANNIYNLGTIEGVKVGDYFYSDGSFSSKLNGKTVVGVVFYVGDPTQDDTTLARDYAGCTHGLVVGLTQSNGMIGQNVSWENSAFMTTIGAKYQRGVQRVEPAASLKTGYNNTMALKAADSGANALAVCADMPVVQNASTWFLPTIAEFDAMFESLGTVKETLKTISDAKDLSGAYSTMSAEDSQYVVSYNIETKALGDLYKSQSGNLRPIFAF